ncbi:hypothetical protein D3C80_334800 [compost metagenome]
MKSAITLLFLILLTSCQTPQASRSKFVLSNTIGPTFTVTGSSAASPEQFKNEMTHTAAREAHRRGYPVIALVRNSQMTTQNGFNHMAASYIGLNSFSEAGKRQAVAVSSYVETDNVSGHSQTTNTSKYRGGLFLPTTPEGRAADAALERISAAIF